jgi:hypothetical protein
MYAQGPEEMPEDPEVTPEDRALLEEVAEPAPSQLPSEWPISIRRVADYILDEYVLDQCINYENKRITNYTEE